MCVKHKSELPHLLVGCEDSEIDDICGDWGLDRVLVVDDAFEALDVLNTLAVGYLIVGSAIEGMRPDEFQAYLAKKSWCQFQRLVRLDGMPSEATAEHSA